MRILSIETSCDETAIAVVECSGKLSSPKFKVIKNIVSSQIEIHRPFGGVVPMLAKREHIRNLPLVYDSLKLGIDDTNSIDAIAVTVGPGLEPALWTGINFAKDLSRELKKPLIGVNHLEAHLYSSLISGEKILLPAIGLIVSGGHTILLLLEKIGKHKKLGETRDDAAGEAYDKVARLIGLPYPGGPEIEKLSHEGNTNAINFPRPMIHHKNYDFSFSGLKTAVFYEIRNRKLTKKMNADVAASFQQAVIDVLSFKTMHAVEEYRAKSVILAGGVSANKTIRKRLKSESRKRGVKLLTPDIKYSTDNATMIAVSAYINYMSRAKGIKPELRGKKYRITANGNLSL